MEKAVNVSTGPKLTFVFLSIRFKNAQFHSYDTSFNIRCSTPVQIERHTYCIAWFRLEKRNLLPDVVLLLAAIWYQILLSQAAQLVCVKGVSFK
jgi:hypothetical protein